MNDLLVLIGLLALAVSHLGVVLMVGRMSRQVDQILAFIRSIDEALDDCTGDHDLEVAHDER